MLLQWMKDCHLVSSLKKIQSDSVDAIQADKVQEFGIVGGAGSFKLEKSQNIGNLNYKIMDP